MVALKKLFDSSVHSQNNKEKKHMKRHIHNNFIFLWRGESKKQELRAHMALVTRREELRAKRSYGMSSNKIL